MKKFLNEFSKLACVCMFFSGILCLVGYWVAIFIGRKPDSQVVKWAIDLLIVPFFGYIAYQLGMKSSLNKNGLYVAKDGTIKKIDRE
ncbi:MAG: hypothetical protein VB062_04540 [Christensenella sp.]|nr:hypothetical protein [Christensenella sp.]